MKTQEHTAGATRIARLIAGDDESCVFIRGDSANFDERGWTTQDDLAEIIDRETHAPQLLKALELIADCVRRDRDARRDVKIYNGKLYKDAVQLRADFLTQAVDTAEEAIRSAKGETL